MLVNLDLLAAAHAKEFPPRQLNFILYNPYGCYAICNDRDFSSQPANRSSEYEWLNHQWDDTSPEALSGKWVLSAIFAIY
jgi:hypothetical protein